MFEDEPQVLQRKSIPVYGKLPKVDKFKLQELIDLQAPELETYVEEGNVPIFGYNTVLYSNRCKE